MKTVKPESVRPRMTDSDNGDGAAGDVPRVGGIHISIPEPKYSVLRVRLIGTAPYVQNKFSAKARQQMKEKQEAGTQANKGKKRESKDFRECYEQSLHRTKEGWCGIPANSFRNALIDACRMVGFKMTLAKCSLFAEADGYDCDDGTPLVRFTKGEPRYFEACTRNESGVADIRARGMWDTGWETEIRIRYNADQFQMIDVVNLLAHAGISIGIGEGRPFSKNSAGMGWGTFAVKEEQA